MGTTSSVWIYADCSGEAGKPLTIRSLESSYGNQVLYPARFKHVSFALQGYHTFTISVITFMPY
jgi:hypothetical protein